MTIEDLLNDLSAMGVTPDDYHRCELMIDEEGGVYTRRVPGAWAVNLMSDHVQESMVWPMMGKHE